MAEITKVTTPMIPRENMGRSRPVTEQAFELHSPARVNKPEQDKNIMDRDPGGQALKDAMGRASVLPLLREGADVVHQIQRMITMLQMGLSTSDIVAAAPMRDLLESMFVKPEALLSLLMEQDQASQIFKGEPFDMLRNVANRFSSQPMVRDALVQLLKSFEYNVNLKNSIQTILFRSESLLDYMFSQDREQFGRYLDGLTDMLLPYDEPDALPGNRPPANQPQTAQQQSQPAQQTGNQPPAQVPQQPETQQPGTQQPDAQQPQQLGTQQPEAQQTQQPGTQPPGTPQQQAEPPPLTAPPPSSGERQAVAQSIPADLTQSESLLQSAEQSARRPADIPLYDSRIGIDPREAASVLKNNLLPLLGEIVVKYYQNESMRDAVMVVVHNIVRVDKGTPQALNDAAAKLVEVLGKVANLPVNFQRNLTESLQRSANRARNTPNEVMEKLSTVVSETLRSPSSSPAALRQAENLLISLLQNQSSMMNLLHFILPLDSQDGRSYAEVFVDPDSEESKNRAGENGRKIFLAVESETHGSMELCFWEMGDRVEFAMWCSKPLVEPLNSLRRTVGNLIQAHGYTMSAFSVEELKTPHSIVQVFPKLLDRKVGIDVRI